MLKSLDDAQRAYVRALRELQLSDGEAYARAHREYQSALEEAQRKYQQVCAEAFSAYKDRSGDPGAYDEYVAVVQRAWAEAQDRFANAYVSYCDATAKVWESSSHAYRNAFQDYVRALKEGFASCDAEAVFPEPLLRAAQGISVTAQWAAGTPAANPAVAPGTGGKGRSRSAKL